MPTTKESTIPQSMSVESTPTKKTQTMKTLPPQRNLPKRNLKIVHIPAITKLPKRYSKVHKTLKIQ